MCGCKKNAKQQTLLSPLRTADQLVADGVAAWYQYNGPHVATTRRGEATGTRYPVSHTRCVLLSIEDYKMFFMRNANEFTPCPTEPVSAVKVVPVVSKPIEAVAAPVLAVVETETRVTVVDITTLTVHEALPIIREAGAHALKVWEAQELGRANGPRQMIVAAIVKRQQEANLELIAA